MAVDGYAGAYNLRLVCLQATASVRGICGAAASLASHMRTMNQGEASLEQMNTVRALAAGIQWRRVRLMCVLPNQVIGGMVSHLKELDVNCHATHNAGYLLIVEELAKQRGQGLLTRALAKLSSAVSRRPPKPSLLDLLKVHKRRLLAHAVGQARRSLLVAKGQALTQWCVATLSIALHRQPHSHRDNGDPGARTTQTWSKHWAARTLSATRWLPSYPSRPFNPATMSGVRHSSSKSQTCTFGAVSAAVGVAECKLLACTSCTGMHRAAFATSVPGSFYLAR